MKIEFNQRKFQSNTFYQIHFFALKFPITVTEYFAYNSVPSFVSKKLMTVIEAKKGKNGRKSK